MPSSHVALHGGSTIAQLYLAAFRKFPDKQAIVSDGLSLTYGALNKLCNQLARVLRANGLTHQDAIAFLVGNRTEAIAAIIAAQLLGLRSISLHPMASQEDHLFVLGDANVKALIVDSPRYTARALAIREQGTVEHILTLDDSAIGPGLVNQAAGMDASDFVPDSAPEDITKIAYTGGTTGRSKGILHPHRSTVTAILYQLASFEWPDDMRFLAATPISHASGTMIVPTFLRGGTVYLLDKYDATGFLRTVEKYRINCTFLVPTQIYGLLDLPNLQEHDFSSLALILYGAAPIAPARLLEGLSKMGRIFGQLYGQAEAPMAVSYLSKKDHDPARPHLLQSCGTVIAGNQVKLLDSQLNDVPTGEVGELCVRGPLVMDGYLNRPEENEKVFAGDWLHTGDMARFDAQGYVYIVDRAKDMIISGGFNVYPSEVENCLAQHPDIAMSAVIGIPHEKWGEAVMAIVVAKPGRTPSEQEVIDYVTHHKGVVNAPKSVHFETELPLTALGKINKKEIRARFWSGQARNVS